MQMYLPFGVFKKKLRLSSNEPLALNKVLKPFGLSCTDNEIDQELSLASLIEKLAKDFYDFECITPIDVADAALELGFYPARVFLEDAPIILANLINRK